MLVKCISMHVHGLLLTLFLNSNSLNWAMLHLMQLNYQRTLPVLLA